MVSDKKTQAAFLTAILAAGGCSDSIQQTRLGTEERQAFARQVVIPAMGIALFANKDAMRSEVQEHWDKNAEYVTALNKQYVEQLALLKVEYEKLHPETRRCVDEEITKALKEKRAIENKDYPVAAKLLAIVKDFTEEKVSSQTVNTDPKGR